MMQSPNTGVGGKDHGHREKSLECCECGFVCKKSELKEIKSKSLAALGVKGSDYVCPKCEHDDFYDLSR